MSPLPGPQHQHAHGRALLIGDFWEKLAGASIALTTAVSLCTRGGFDLVERAHAAAKDVDAADLLARAAMRLRQARAQQYVVVW